ncbi:MAG TPA: ribosome assembly RNA-binding protein YhbY, partial [Thauera phenylacetica]|nr:ribosome assembly RNA-binding protein YhbY [Thauera phenylacetica]
MTELTPAERSDLRARAHHLNPVVTVAGNGLTPAVLAEIERALQAHELIKVKVQGAEREQREALMQELCTAVDAAPVQHIGSILVVWRARREDEKTAAPAEKKPARASTAKQAQSRQKALAKMQPIAAVVERRPLCPALPAP